MAFSINSNFRDKLNKQLEEDKKASKVTKAGKVQKDIKAHEDAKDTKDTKVHKAHKDVNTSSRGKGKVQSKEPEAEVVKELMVKDNGKGYKE